jgi:hypothetical protein
LDAVRVRVLHRVGKAVPVAVLRVRVGLERVDLPVFVHVFAVAGAGGAGSRAVTEAVTVGVRVHRVLHTVAVGLPALISFASVQHPDDLTPGAFKLRGIG